MSHLNRMQRLAKAYINNQYDRLTALERELAEQELNEEKEQPIPDEDNPPATIAPRLMTRTVSGEDKWAYQDLGIEAGSDFAVARDAYYKIIKRIETYKFEPDSDEYKKSQAIKQRVDNAYDKLRQKYDTGSRRFSHLEPE